MAEAARKHRLPVLWRIPAAWRLLQDPAARGWEKALVAGAAIYVALPWDAIPDLAPFIGWLDDAGVVTVAAIALRKSLKRY